MRRHLDQATPPLRPTTKREFTPLSDFVETAHKSLEGNTGFGIVLQLSRLNNHPQGQGYQSLCSDYVSRFCKAHGAKAYQNSQGDIVCYSPKGDPSEIKVFVLRVRALFIEDPKVLTQDSKRGPYSALVRSYDLKKEGSAFIEILSKLMGYQKETSELGHTADKWVQLRGGRTEPLTPDNFEEIHEKILHLDATSLMQSQPICTFDKAGQPEEKMREIYISLADLQSAVCPGVNLLSNTWLFQQISLLLDQKILSYLADKRQCAHPERASLNLNVSSVLSEEFQQYVHRLGENSKNLGNIELQKTDVFSNLGSFFYARDYLQDLGFTVCLDGMTSIVLPYLSVDQLGFDYVKVYATKELIDPGQEEDEEAQLAAKKARQLISKCKGPHKFVLAHCETEEAISWGAKNGVSLFQGWYIDKTFMIGADTPKGV